ncbi:hypothetical protein KO539_24495 [Janthinobacterium sp. NKUCC06_STL]|nr:hypothetical protein [Janthinobacterium sp. NKUCC06_STL]
MKKYFYAIILILSISQVHSKANEEVPITKTKREVIAKLPPITYETLRRLEKRRGVSYKEDELRSVLQSAEFTREQAVVLQEFCVKKENAAICSSPSTTPRAGSSWTSMPTNPIAAAPTYSTRSKLPVRSLSSNYSLTTTASSPPALPARKRSR